MSKNERLTLEEAIKHCEEKAIRECGKCGEDHKQLAEWLKELVKLKARMVKINNIAVRWHENGPYEDANAEGLEKMMEIEALSSLEEAAENNARLKRYEDIGSYDEFADLKEKEKQKESYVCVVCQETFDVYGDSADTVEYCPYCGADTPFELTDEMFEGIKGISEKTDPNACPECGAKINHAGGCIECPSCGWSACR